MRSMMHNKQERKRKELDIKKKKEEQKKNKEGFEVTMSVEIITFKKLGFFFPFTWPLFSSQVLL